MNKQQEKKDWSGYCATTENRNQCSDNNCTIFPICLIKKKFKPKKEMGK